MFLVPNFCAYVPAYPRPSSWPKWRTQLQTSTHSRSRVQASTCIGSCHSGSWARLPSRSNHSTLSRAKNANNLVNSTRYQVDHRFLSTFLWPFASGPCAHNDVSCLPYRGFLRTAKMIPALAYVSLQDVFLYLSILSRPLWETWSVSKLDDMGEERRTVASWMQNLVAVEEQA